MDAIVRGSSVVTSFDLAGAATECLCWSRKLGASVDPRFAVAGGTELPRALAGASRDTSRPPLTSIAIDFRQVSGRARPLLSILGWIGGMPTPSSAVPTAWSTSR